MSKEAVKSGVILFCLNYILMFILLGLSVHGLVFGYKNNKDTVSNGL